MRKPACLKGLFVFQEVPGSGVSSFGVVPGKGGIDAPGSTAGGAGFLLTRSRNC